MPSSVLLVTNGPISTSPRCVKEADTLGRAGYDVTVLMVRNRAAIERQDAELLRTAPFRREAVDMIPGFSTGPGRLLLRRGLYWFARKMSGSFGLPTAEALAPARALLRRARALPAELTIVHNEAPHWVGLRLMDRGRLVAADIEDWHSEDLLPRDRFRRPLGLIRANERGLLRRAAYTSTTSRALADGLHARYGGRRPIVIANSFPLQPDPRRGRFSRPLSLFWFSQTIGPGRGLELFLAAWAIAVRPSELALLGDVQPAYREKLLRRLPPGHRERVRFLATVPPSELPAVIARHDVGLALELPAPENKNLTIPNKILQYLNAGLAVLASDTAGHREVLEQAPAAGLVLPLGETGRLASALDELASDPDRIAAMSAAARRAAEERFCWEKEAPRLLEAVASALS